jgi:hypothetical protein
LADVLVGQFCRFQVNENKTFEQVVVENEIDEEMACLRADTELATDEGKPFPHLKQKPL